MWCPQLGHSNTPFCLVIHVYCNVSFVGAEVTVLYFGLHFFKVTIPPPLVIKEDQPVYGKGNHGRSMNEDYKRKWDTFMSAVMEDRLLISEVFSDGCSHGRFIPVREDTWIHYFESTIPLSSVKESTFLPRIQVAKEKVVPRPDLVPNSKYLLPYFLNNDELQAMTENQDVAEKFWGTTTGWLHHRLTEFNENQWSERLLFGLEQIYKGKPLFAFIGRSDTDPWVQFKTMKLDEGWFICRGAPDFLVGRGVMVVDQEQSEEPGVIECKTEKNDGLGQLVSAMMLLAAREVLISINDDKELPTVVSVSGLLLKRKSDCTI